MSRPDMTMGPFKMLCAGGMDNTPVNLPNNPTIDFRRLCQVYLDQVDPVIKILHRPSLSKFMEHGERYLDYPESSVAALSAAVCYAAACSLSEMQCQAMFQNSKASVVALTQRACESALEQAEILITSDITVLQAFVLYLVRLVLLFRGSDKNRADFHRSGEGPKNKAESCGPWFPWQ